MIVARKRNKLHFFLSFSLSLFLFSTACRAHAFPLCLAFRLTRSPPSRPSRPPSPRPRSCTSFVLAEPLKKKKNKRIAAAVFLLPPARENIFSCSWLPELLRCSAFLPSSRGQTSALQARVLKGGLKACCLGRGALATNERKRNDDARAHHPSITLLFLDNNKNSRSSWPFVAGLAFSGAIFFKIATGVTGEW